MGSFKLSLMVLLLLVIGFVSQRPRVAEAAGGPLSFLPQQRYPKILATLGVVCKCCDGQEGDCTTTWVEPCSKLQCLPWKLL